MNIIISARGQPKKFNVPHRSQDDPEDNDASRKSWHGEQLTDREEVRDARERQRGHEVRPTSIAEVA
jgi:hypothetical protein